MVDNNIPTQISPIEILEEIASKNEWPCKNDSETDVLSIVIPGEYNSYKLSSIWVENTELLVIRVCIPIYPVPEYQQYELFKLLNLVNENAIYGCWFTLTNLEGEFQIVWRQEIHSDIETVDERRLDMMVTSCINACDTIYPAISLFLTAKPRYIIRDGEIYFKSLGMSAEQALDFLDTIKPIGRA